MCEQAGKMFEPLLIDKLEENLSAVIDIRERYRDPSPTPAAEA